MDYLIRWLSEQATAKYWWWLLFIVLAALVVTFAKLSVNLLESIAERTKIASAFIGGVMLSILTSLPELVSAIYAGIEHRPDYGISNAFGANMLTAFLLGVIDLAFLKKFMFKSVDRGNKILMLIMIVINVVILLGIATPDAKWKEIPGINVSWLNLLPLLCFIGYAIWASLSGGKKDDDIDLKKVASKDKVHKKVPFENIPLWQVWIYFTLAGAALVFFAFNNATAVDKFSPQAKTGWGEKGVYGIPVTTGAGLILSIATSLPEITSIIVLMRKGLPNIAIGGIIGSHLFNVSLIGITDLIDQTPGTSFTELHSQGGGTTYTAWIVGALVVTLFLYLNSIRWTKTKSRIPFPVPYIFVRGTKIEKEKLERVVKPKWYYTLESVFLIASYLLAFLLTTFVFQ